ncbi:hypothetical protein KPH14_006344 [Odynerus spinipes]|uniref:Uncharacterized protein n=1 Tax=Odynerus spinipes TaxID=1348599 RepID=A0AAD9RZ13_9HYME|nr:hypothetical protein KPH14_006344 [Odynerus spinipes]
MTFSSEYFHQVGIFSREMFALGLISFIVNAKNGAASTRIRASVISIDRSKSEYEYLRGANGEVKNVGV